MITKEPGELFLNENVHEKTGKFSSYPDINKDMTGQNIKADLLELRSNRRL